MRSSEVAKLAGVTTRALRHYHAIGLLDEPPRSANGYRDYGIAALTRVLRIKHLASLGFPLARIGEMLATMDDPSADRIAVNAPLDALDRELALQIERLQEQRAIIAQLKREQLEPDLPVDFARVVKDLLGDDPRRKTSDAVRANREAILVAGHLCSENDLAELERLATGLIERGLLPRLHEIDARCDALAPDAPEDERRAIVDDAMAILDQALDCFDLQNWTRDQTEAELLINTLGEAAANAAQLDVTNRITNTLYAHLLAYHEEHGNAEAVAALASSPLHNRMNLT